MLDLNLSRQRQKRLLDRLGGESLDAIVITQPHHVHYLTAHRAAWRHVPALVLHSDGRATLISANIAADHAAADEVIAYRANLASTLRQDQAAELCRHVIDRIGHAKRVGFDSSQTASLLLQQRDRSFVCIDETLFQMRRPKDADELALMRKAIDATAAMYERAGQVIEPGVSEIEVFNQLHAAAVEATGEPMTALLGNDFQCGTGGGPARAGRRAEAGELYVLDLGPTYRGYFADNARVVAVDRRPTDQQIKAWQGIADVFPIVEALARPGVRCREIYHAIDEHFADRFDGQRQVHHLGHGVGLEAHEFPHLNPQWDDTLMEGEILTCEPGIYRPALRGAIRLENQYRVTASGVENLTPFPLRMC